MMRAITSRVLDMLGGQTIVEAEALLDTARRMVWIHVFSGRTMEIVARELGASPEAHEAAVLLLAEISGQLVAPVDVPGGGWRLIEGLAVADAILSEVRLTLYVGTYRNDETSRFGRHAASWMEEAERYAQPPPH